MAGSLVKIDEEIVSSAVASVTLTGIDSTYDVYKIVINKCKVDTDDKDIRIRFTESGTPNTTANYDNAGLGLDTGSAFDDISATNETSLGLSLNIGNATDEQFNSIIYIFNANNSGEFTFCTFENTVITNLAILKGKQGGGVFTVASAVNGIQFIGDSTNIDTGSRFVLYGLKK